MGGQTYDDVYEVYYIFGAVMQCTNLPTAADGVYRVLRSPFCSDCELFVSEILYDENLTENAQETRQILLNNFRIVHTRLEISRQRLAHDAGLNHSHRVT